jgi:hypothetical protein
LCAGRGGRGFIAWRTRLALRPFAALLRLLRPLAARRTWLARFASFATFSFRLLLQATFRPRRASAAWASLFLRAAASAAGALVELLHFALHELAHLCVRLRAHGVVTTVGATLPPFGIGLLARLT